jgi:hypothetical protein
MKTLRACLLVLSAAALLLALFAFSPPAQTGLAAALAGALLIGAGVMIQGRGKA